MVRSALVFAIAALALALPSAGSAAPPSNDDFASATTISSLPLSDSVDVSESILEGGEPGGGCWPLAGSVWYSIQPAQDEILQILSSASFDRTVTVYRQNASGFGGLSQVACGYSWSQVTARLDGGSTYYIQAGRTPWTGTGQLDLQFSLVPPPANDDFADAAVVGSLTYSDTESSLAATREPGEPMASCGPNTNNSHWYAYTAPAAGSVTVRTGSGTWPVIGLYRGAALDALTEIGCRSGGGSLLTFAASAGQTTYIQIADVYSGNYGPITTSVEIAPAPVASFSSWPWDPSTFDSVSFGDNSSDPGGNPIVTRRFEFGDGSSSTTPSPQHRYFADGDYNVRLTVTTSDGRTASSEQTVHVRTHDVAITRLGVPQSASSGQTRGLSVELKNTRYAESVTVTFFRSHVGGGWDQIGTQTQTVPVRSGNKTTAFSVLYTFMADDKAVGKVTFRAVATINGPRDALPADNEIIALPTKVN